MFVTRATTVCCPAKLQTSYAELVLMLTTDTCGHTVCRRVIQLEMYRV